MNGYLLEHRLAWAIPACAIGRLEQAHVCVAHSLARLTDWLRLRNPHHTNTGVNGSDTELLDRLAVYNQSHFYAPGEIGCTLGHLEAIRCV